MMSSRATNLTILKYCGIWRPEEWNSGWKFWLYNIFTAIVIFFIFTVPLAQCTELFSTVIYGDAPVVNVHITMMMIYQCSKVIIMVGYRQRVIKLLATLESDMCQAKNQEERSVQQTFHRSIRLRSKAYGSLIGVTIIAMTVTYCTLHIPKRTLPHQMWLPFKITTDYVYGLVFADEWITTFLGAIIAIGFDTFMFEIILKICIQFGTLKCRIRNIDTILSESLKDHESKRWNGDPEKVVNNRIIDCVRHHLLVYDVADEANRIFGPAILLNYMTNTAVICTGVIKLSQIKGLTIQLVALVIYIFIFITEMFVLCYTGSELIDESRSIGHVIYGIHWHLLSKSNKKSILIMMTRSSKPVIFTSGKIFQVSVDSAVKLIQFTYSAYTCLKQMST